LCLTKRVCLQSNQRAFGRMMRLLVKNLVLLSLIYLQAFPSDATKATAFFPTHFSEKRIIHNSCQASSLTRNSELGASPLSDDVDISSGLYRRFSDHAWKKIEASGWFQDAQLPTELVSNQAPAKGTKDSVVRISTKAMVPKNEEHKNLVRYARVALLETVSSSSTGTIQSGGIQVLNLVVMPSNSSSLPVLGIDLVSLPGNRHLLLLDAQPMTHPNLFEDQWKEWYTSNVACNPNFPWGGDFPEPVQQYVSKYALWTRLQGSEDPVSIIQKDVWDAFVDHLDIYLDLLKNCDTSDVQGLNQQSGYLEYRRNTDPAKPMLNALYGSEWTDQVLDKVLFPQD